MQKKNDFYYYLTSEISQEGYELIWNLWKVSVLVKHSISKNFSHFLNTSARKLNLVGFQVDFDVGDTVLYINRKKKWKAGVILQLSPLTLRNEAGSTFSRECQQIQKIKVKPSTSKCKLLLCILLPTYPSHATFVFELVFSLRSLKSESCTLKDHFFQTQIQTIHSERKFF